MPQPYSADLRERILVAYEQGEGSQVAIARRFRVCPATVCNWIRQARQEGRRCPKPHRGGPAGRLGSRDLALLQGLVAEANDAYLDQYAERLFALTGKRVSRSVMCRTLQRLKLTVKKRPSGRPSRSGPTLRPSVRLTASRLAACPRNAWCSWMKAG
jgi:transposase